MQVLIGDIHTLIFCCNSNDFKNTDDDSIIS